MSDPLISAILPSYNHAPYILDAVESVLAQDLEVPLEVIVVDDGSTDGSRELLIERFGDRSEVRLELRTHHGVSATFNRGLELARGAWVGFCCSDDRWQEGHLKIALANLATHGDALISFGSARIIDGTGALSDGVRLFGEVTDPQPLAQLLLHGNSLCFSAALFKRGAAHEVGGFDPELRVLQDYDLWLKLLQLGTAAHVMEATVDFRWDGENASGACASEQKRRDTIRVLERALADFPLLAEDAELRTSVTKRLAAAHHRLSRRTGDRDEKRRHLRRAFELNRFSRSRYRLELLKICLAQQRGEANRPGT